MSLGSILRVFGWPQQKDPEYPDAPGLIRETPEARSSARPGVRCEETLLQNPIHIFLQKLERVAGLGGIAFVTPGDSRHSEEFFTPSQ